MTPSQPLSAVDPPRRAWFKATLFTLLACNAVIYATSGTFSEMLDSIAWLVLLVLYELETDFGLGAHGGWAARTVRGGRLIAATAVVAAAAGYVGEREWLDAINTGLWLALVIIFEWQVRFHAIATHRRMAFNTAVSLLYGGLAVLIAAW